MAAPKIRIEPIKSRRTFEEVSHRIKKMIFDKVYQPGDKLPPEAELALQFGVGRQSVREALRILELSGFVKIQKGGGGGAIIKDTIRSTISGLFLDAFQLKETSIQELTLARVEIEKVVLKYAIENADGEDIRLLRENVAESIRKIEDNKIVIDENIEFHRILAKASKNHIFVLVVEAVTAPLRHCLAQIVPPADVSDDASWNRDRTVQSKNSLGYHEQIIAALCEKNLDAATRLLEEHLLEVANRLTALVGDSK